MRRGERDAFEDGRDACAARRLVRCDAEVVANQGNFGGTATDPNVYGDVRGWLANLYLTLDSRILGNPPPSASPVSLPSAPTCEDD